MSLLAIPCEPEIRLLVHAARPELDQVSAVEMRRLLQGPLDWHFLLKAAGYHGLTSLLYWHLHGKFSDAIPPAVHHYLRMEFHARAKHSLTLTGELCQLVDRFQQHGIVAIAHKGPVLAQLAYGNLVLREFSDLDLFVRPDDAMGACRLLQSAGYRPFFKLAPQYELAFLRTGGDRGFESADGRIHVEVHWEVLRHAYSFPYRLAECWDRAKPIELAGHRLLSFAPEDVLVFLCAQHTAKHRWDQLRWIGDVAAWCSSHRTLDWQGALVRARAAGGERMLFLGLVLARELWGLELAAASRIHVGSATRRLGREILKELLRRPRARRSLLHLGLFHLRCRERVRDRVLACVRQAVTLNENDWSLYPLPAPLFPLYYPLRAARLARSYLSRAAS